MPAAGGYNRSVIYCLFGENTYLRDQALAALVGDRTIERVNGQSLGVRDLPDLFMGQSLFAADRLIVIRNLAENAAVWQELETYCDQESSETTLIILETKPDKRTKTFKALQENAQVREFMLPKNAAEAIKFTLDEAKNRHLKFDRRLAQQLVDRTGFNPWEIIHALEKLAVLDIIDEAAITRSIDASPSEQIFGLLEASLNGRVGRVHAMCETLALSEEPYRVMGLLATQVTYLAALVAADTRQPIAADLGTKPFAIDKLRTVAKKMTRSELRRIVDALATADDQMKSTGAEPWGLVEQALMKIATRN